MSDDHHFVGRAVPELEEPVLVVMLTGWIDASGAAAAAMGALDKECDGDDRSSRSTTTRTSTTGPAGRCSSCATASTPASSGGARAEASAATSTATTCCCSAGPSPTWRGTASPTRSPTSPSGFGVATHGGARRLPVRRAAHPAAAPVGDVAVGRGARRAAASAPARSTCRPAWPRRSSTPCTSGASPPSASGRRCRTTWRRCRTRRRRVALLEGAGRRPPASRVDAAELRREAVLQRERLDELVEGNDEHRAMVAQLERLYDAAERATPTCGAAPTTGGARAAHRRRAGRRGRALPARPGQELSSTRRVDSTVGGHEGRRRTSANDHRQGRRRRRPSSRRPATPAAGRPRRATTRSCRSLLGRRAHHRDSSSARRSPSPSPATR